MNTESGVRAVVRAKPITAASVDRYWESKFGDALPEVRKTMSELADSLRPDELVENAFSLYEQFRPMIPEGVRGWGAKGELDLEQVRRLAHHIGSLA